MDGGACVGGGARGGAGNMAARKEQGRPLRPGDGSGVPWDGRREDAERTLDLVAANAELDGGERSRRRRQRAFPRRAHGRVQQPLKTNHWNF
jgi:hypothetical protein